MHNSLLLLFVMAVALAAATLPAESAPKARRDGTTVACYYFGNYHPGDPRNEAVHGKGWTEWELVKAAKPRFPGHQQPIVPQWGYTDESDPKAMAQKIDAAADHGVDAFIFDWYYYNDGPFLERSLDRGFLGAKNNRRLRFALMWANHDWNDIHPARLDRAPKLLYPGAITPETWERMTDLVIRRYFKHPSYWKIDGRPYFSVYELYRLVQSFGSVERTRAAIDRFRAKTKAAGFPDLHLNGVTWGVQILPGEQAVKNPAELTAALGLDSTTSYVWIHHVPLPQFPQTPYRHVMDEYFKYAETAGFGVPYYPNVTMGWDSSPRAHGDNAFENRGYPFMATLSGNTPDLFREALERAKASVLKRPPSQRVVTINCWNEWTEGSYLEPDTRNGMAYLEAVRAVFPPRR
ncbi:MAG TPA: glycoside hydrolase family 99-like domain-containing protein [Armatimonadota bacterium]|nr:glycoside hydrolase family 99-like domain-containing protein [Armatimonadota bacterium]